MDTHSFPAPGHVLLENFLEKYNISQVALSGDLDIPQSRIAEIVSGKRGITLDTATRLSSYFGTSVAYWLNLQNGYDIAESIRTGQQEAIRENIRARRKFSSTNVPCDNARKKTLHVVCGEAGGVGTTLFTNYLHHLLRNEYKNDIAFVGGKDVCSFGSYVNNIFRMERNGTGEGLFSNETFSYVYGESGTPHILIEKDITVEGLFTCFSKTAQKHLLIESPQHFSQIVEQDYKNFWSCFEEEVDELIVYWILTDRQRTLEGLFRMHDFVPEGGKVKYVYVFNHGKNVSKLLEQVRTSVDHLCIELLDGISSTSLFHWGKLWKGITFEIEENHLMLHEALEQWPDVSQYKRYVPLLKDWIEDGEKHLMPIVLC